MATIQSKKELMCNSRTGKTGIIRVEISNWAYEVKSKQYRATVRDYVVEQVAEGEINYERLLPINTKEVIYSKVEIDALFLQLQNPIELIDSYTDEMDNLISQALLYVTQTEPIYQSEASDWKIYEASVNESIPTPP